MKVRVCGSVLAGISAGVKLIGTLFIGEDEVQLQARQSVTVLSNCADHRGFGTVSVNRSVVVLPKHFPLLCCDILLL